MDTSHPHHVEKAQWWTSYAAKSGTLAVTGPYAHVRHPQYGAFVLIMFGFLLQWPTLPTLVLFPILIATYGRLAKREDRDVAKRFPTSWADYAARTPAFVPRFRDVFRSGPKQSKPLGSH